MHQANTNATTKCIAVYTLATCLALTPAATTHARLDTLLSEGDPTPSDDGTFASINPPITNNAGQIAFRAYLTDTPGGFTDNHAIFMFQPDGTFIQITREGTPAPGTAGGDFGSFDELALNDNNQILFESRSMAGAGAANEGIFRADLDPDTLIVTHTEYARSTQPVTDMIGETELFNRFGRTGFNNSGYATFPARTTDGSTSSGLFITNGSTLNRIAEQGATAPDGNGSYGEFLWSAYSSFAAHPLGQDVTFYATFTGTAGGSFPATDDTGIFAYDGTTVTTTLRKGDPDPNGSGTIAAVFSNHIATEGNNTAYIHRTDTGSDFVDSLTFNSDGTPITLHSEYDPAPGGNGFFNQFGLDNFNPAGQFVFSAALTGTANGLDDDSGFFLASETNTIPLFREGDPVPDGNGIMPNSGFFTADINDHGIVVFDGQAIDPVTKAITDQIIFLTDGEEMVMAARGNQPVDGGNITNLIASFTSDQGGHDKINGYGQVPFLAEIDGVVQNLYLFTPDLHWRRTNPAGNWSNPDNWTLGIQPAHVHHLIIDPDAPVNIAGPLADTTIPALTLGGGLANATLNIDNTTLTIETPLTIQPNGHLILTNGATLDTNRTNIGTNPAPGTDATISAYGPTTNLNATGSGSLFIIAKNANATLNLHDGATATSNNITIAEQPGSNATVNLTGPGTILNSFGSLLVADAGTATLNILAGATAYADDTSSVAADPTSIATVNIDGPGSTYDVPNAEITFAISGTATLNMTNYAEANFTEVIFAQNATSLANINLAGPGTRINTDDLYLAFRGTNHINANSGSIIDVNGDAILARYPTAYATANLTNPGTKITADNLTIADEGSADVSLHNAAQLDINSSIKLAKSPGSNANLTLSDPGTNIAAATLTVGQSGTANMLIQNAATVDLTSSATLALSGTSNATLTLKDPVTTLATPTLNVGLSGSARVNIQDDALVDATTTTINTNSTINIQGGTLQTDALTGTGTLNLEHGTLEITGGATLTIDTPLFGTNPTLGPNAKTIADTTTIAAPAQLTIDGGNLQTDTLTINGELLLYDGTADTDTTINAGNLTIDDTTLNATTSLTNNADIQLGTNLTTRIQTPTFINTTTGSIAGTARITGLLANAGRINLTNDNLRVDGPIANNDGGLIIGNGTLQSSLLTNQPNATLAFSGPTNIIGDVINQADAFSPDFATIISSGPGPLTFFDDVTNAGEIRTNFGGFTVFLGTTSGSGDYTGTGTVIMEADLTPGTSPGINNFAGNLTFGPAASLAIETQATVTSPVAGTDHDQITIADTLTLDGTLNIQPLTTAGPITDTPYGNEYIAITYTTRTPNSFFHTINGTLINTAFALAPLLNESTNQLTLRATIPGDLNLDNKVSVADLAEFALNFNTAPGLYNETDNQSSWLYGDFNTDGQITVADLSLLALNFGFDAADPTSAPLGLTPAELLAVIPGVEGLDPATLPAVPEPTTLLTLLLTALPLHHRRRSPKLPT